MKIVEFYSLDELLRATRLQKDFIAQNSVGLLDFAGLPYILEIVASAKREIGDFPFVLDCGGNQACVMEGIKLGLRQIIFTGNELLLKKLQEIAYNTECKILRHINDKFE